MSQKTLLNLCLDVLGVEQGTAFLILNILLPTVVNGLILAKKKRPTLESIFGVVEKGQRQANIFGNSTYILVTGLIAYILQLRKL